MNREFSRRLKILLWAAVHDDIRLCRIHGPISLRLKSRGPWMEPGHIYPVLKVTLTIQKPSIYLPSAVQEAYDRRNWTEKQWEAHRTAFDDIPF